MASEGEDHLAPPDAHLHDCPISIRCVHGRRAAEIGRLRMDGHRYIRVESSSDHRGHFAVCSCGWKSEVMTTAGLAGTKWDEHRDAIVNVATQELDP